MDMASTTRRRRTDRGGGRMCEDGCINGLPGYGYDDEELDN